MKRFICGAIGCLFPILLIVQAQESAGTYTTYIAGKPLLTESYILSSEPDGTLKAEAEIIASGVNQKTTTIAAPGKPVSFSVETGGTKQMSAEFSNSTVKLQVTGQAERELNTKATIILENLVWHHYVFLLNQYDVTKGGSQSFTAFLPSRATDFGLQVERLATPGYLVDGRPVATERYRLVSTSGVVIDVWTDTARVPLLFFIESQGVKAVRHGSESLAEAALAALTKPAATAPFLSEEVTFQNEGVTLAGTLTIPKNEVERHPAAVLISGSGAQDRDENPGGFGLFKLIAERLSSSGLAVLRHDDRGFGKSTVPTKPTTYRDLINDSKAAIDYLRRRKEIDPDRIALIGHSEGGGTAAIIASEDPRMAAIALLAGASLSKIDRLALEQALYQAALKEPVNPSDRTKLPEDSRQVLQLIEQAKAGKKLDKEGAAATSVYEYFRQHLALDPRATFKQVRCPVLILQGERDDLVLAHHALEVAQALAEAGHRQVLVRIFPNLSHVFTASPLDKALAFEQRSQISPDVLETLRTWIVNVLTNNRDERPRE